MATQLPGLTAAESTAVTDELGACRGVSLQLPLEPGERSAGEWPAVRQVVRGAVSDFHVGIEGRNAQRLQVLPVHLCIGPGDVRLATDEIRDGRMHLRQDRTLQAVADHVLVVVG